jgi:RNA polymerase sigma-70 factor (ECF subfamily)
VARNRLIDRRREHHRAIEQERPLDDLKLHEQPRTDQPRPSEVAQGEELWQRMLESCPPAHQEILRLKREGFPLTEIAVRTGLHEGSIRRILYNLASRLAVPRRTTGSSLSASPDEV